MMTFRTWKDAHTAAVNDARLLQRPMGIEAVIEYGRSAFRVQMLPKDPNQRFGWETRCEVVEPTDPL